MVRFIACAAILMGLSGCANTLPQQKTVETSYDRQLKSQKLSIATSESGSIIYAPQFSVEVNNAKTFNVKQYELQTVYDVYTPYEGWREIYEVPMGIVALPLAVTVNLLDFCLLGLIPNSFTDYMLDVSFSGMNPFLNIESESRFEKTVAKREQKTLDEKEEFIKKPLDGGEIKVSSATVSIAKRLDANGKAEINLLELKTGETPLEQILLSVENEGAKASLSMNLSRQLAARLGQAHEVSKRYDTSLAEGTTNSKSPAIDVQAVAKDIVKLSKIGFDRESKTLETKVFPLLSADDQVKLKKLINDALL